MKSNYIKKKGVMNMGQYKGSFLLVKVLIMTLFCMSSYSLALAQPVPNLSIEATPTSLISDGATVEFAFNNTSTTPTEVGFFPMIEITLPDGLTCDAACIASITYSNPGGAPVEVSSEVGAATFVNSVTGEPTTLAAGETIILLTLPVGSVAPGQPAITGSFLASFEDDADFGVVLPITGRGIFAIGDSANGTPGDCNTNDTICEDATVVTNPAPSLLVVDKILRLPVDSATTSGPSFPRTFDIEVDIADGFEVTNVSIGDTIPTEFVSSIGPDCSGLTSVPAFTTCFFDPDPDGDGGIGGGDFSATYASVTGGAGTDDIVLSYTAFVQEFDDANPAIPVIDPTTGATTNSENGVEVNFEFEGAAQATATDSEDLTHSSIFLSKTSSVSTDNPPAQNSPGDVITWRTVVHVSDFFEFEDLDIDDDIQDGQVYNSGSIEVTVVQGAGDTPVTADEVTLGSFFIIDSAPDSTTGITHFDLDLSGAMDDPAVFGLDPVLQGGGFIEITYTTTISQEFIASTGAGNTQIIDGGDVISNNVTLMSKIVGEVGTPLLNSSSSVTITPITAVTKIIADEAPGPVDGQVSPGDVVTFEIAVNVPSGDVENLVIQDFLPNPLFLSAPITQIADCAAGVFPGATEWCFANGTTIPTSTPVNATNNTADNSISFDFMDGVENPTGPAASQLIVLRFAFAASNEPIANGLALVNLISTTHGNSAGQATVSTIASIVELETDFPEITVEKAANTVISGNGAVSAGNFVNVDGGDVLEFEITLRNDSNFSANDVNFQDQVLSGYVQTDGPAEFMLAVVDGGGTVMCDLSTFSDDSVVGEVAGSGITMPANSICIATYRLTVDSSALGGAMINNRVNATFATVPGGTPFSPAFSVSRSTIATPTITKNLVAGSSTDLVSAEGDLFFGESVDFDFAITFPEGSLNNVRVREQDLPNNNPAGNFFGNLAPGDFEFRVNGAPVSALGACANDAALFAYPELPDVCFSAAPTFAQLNSTQHQISLGNVTNFNTDDSITELLTIRVTVTADQITNPDSEGTYLNRAALFWSNGANRSLTGTDTINLLLPDVDIAKASLTTAPVTIGDTITYRVRVVNTGSAPAYDFTGFIDTLGNGLDTVALVSATHAGTDVTGLSNFSFTPSGSTIAISPVNGSNNNQIDPNSTFEIVYTARVGVTRVDDTTTGPGHPGGVVDGPGCVNNIGNNVDIASFATIDGGGAAVTAIDNATTSLALDSDGDGILNSIETVGLTCPDSDNDGVADHLDTDSDDNGISDTTEFNNGANLDGDGLPDYRDLDDDMDGISDFEEITNAGGDPTSDLDGDGVADYMDLDSDNDGILDSVEGDGDSDGDGVPDYLDIDSDNDGITDLVESQPEGVTLVVPTGVDTDGDGLDDAFDSVPGDFGGAGTTPENTDLTDLPDYLDDDSDNDGVIDLIEGNDADGDGLNDFGLVDTDGDGQIDAVDFSDADGDGLDDSYDTVVGPDPVTNSGGSSAPLQNSDTADNRDWRDTDDDNDGILTSGELEDTDGDGTPDYLEVDSDGDGINDADECPTGLPCADTDGDGFPDYLDLDSDGDGIADATECPTGSPCSDFDGDGVADFLDIDADNDGITDLVESQPEGVLIVPTGVDTDNDGIDDAFDTTPAAFGGTGTVPNNNDGVDTPDYIDTDSDNDGVFDLIEGSDANADGINDIGSVDLDNNGIIDPAAFLDADGDGLDDAYDTVAGPDPVANPGGSSAPLQNSDTVDNRDWRDTDDDNDGILTENELGDTNGNGTPDYLDLDSDGDGIPDIVECPDMSNCPDTDGDGVTDNLDPTCNASGVIALRGVGQADFRIENSSGMLVATTDADGAFTIPNLNDGTFVFEAVSNRGSSAGEFIVTALNDDCGVDSLVEAVFALRSPLYFIWNGFYDQQNVVVLQNTGDVSLDAVVTLVSLDGIPLSTQDVTLAPKSEIDLPVNSMPGYSTDTYGHVKVEFDMNTGFDGYFAHYRLAPGGNDIEFSIIRSFESVQKGRTSGAFNTLQPSLDAAAIGDDIPNWVQVVNVNEEEAKTFVLRLYSDAGVLLRENGITLPPRARFDVQAGHEFPGLGNIGTMEVIPLDPESPYLAQLYHYGADGPIATLSDTFAYASGEPTQAGDPNVSYVPISTAANGNNYVVVTNTETTAGTVALDIVLNDGTVIPSVNVAVAPKSQVHVDIQALIGGESIGLATVTPTPGSRLIVRSMMYFRDAVAHATTTAGTTSRPIYNGVQNTSYNTFFNQLNWLKLFNVTNAATTATVDAYDQLGVLIGSSIVNLPANSGADVELNADLGFGIPADSVGIVRVTPLVDGAVRSEMLRVKATTASPFIMDNIGFLSAR